MPLYEYLCEACGHRFEKIRKFSDPPLDECPSCGAEGKVQKLLSSPAIQFKGTGWYITDYAKKSSSEASGSSKSSASDAADKKSDEKKTSDKESSDKKSGDKKSDSSSSGSSAAPAPASSTPSKD